MVTDYIFLILAPNINHGCSYEPLRGGDPNKYPKPVFWAKIRKIMFISCKPYFPLYKMGSSMVFITWACSRNSTTVWAIMKNNLLTGFFLNMSSCPFFTRCLLRINSLIKIIISESVLVRIGNSFHLSASIWKVSANMWKIRRMPVKIICSVSENMSFLYSAQWKMELLGKFSEDAIIPQT